MEWIKHSTEITKPPKGYFGFVYKIIFTEDNKKYIGKKQFYTKRKRNFGKKEIANLADKRLKKYEYVIKESDWRTYTSSNKLVNSRIANGDSYIKVIVGFGLNKKHLTYLEESELYAKCVLWDDRYYNDNIAGRFYTKDVKEWEQIRRLVYPKNTGT